MVVVLVDQVTDRITYVFDFIFSERGIKYELMTSLSEFEKSDVTRKLNYSNHLTDQYKAILPSFLLRETSVIPVEEVKVKFNDVECLAFDGVSDPVATIFYVLTRYEEYIGSRRDQHGRFPYNSSILSKWGWIKSAMADRWARAVIDHIDPDLYIETALSYALLENKFSFVPTFDIDNTFAYKYKTGKRKVLSSLRDLSRFDFGRIQERKAVNNNTAKDPYDTYDKIEAIAKQYKETKVFWLVKSDGAMDRNLDIGIAEHKDLVNRIANLADVNLHPSYASFDEKELVHKELRVLSEVIGGKVNGVRSHFLRFRLPQSYQTFIANEVIDEYSMGFAEHYGFRCGTARAHKWFDLSKNQVTDLNVHPFVYMDGTLNEYMGLTIEESKDIIKALYDEVKTYGGDFVFIWHNETIGDIGKWEGWSEVLDFTLKLKG